MPLYNLNHNVLDTINLKGSLQNYNAMLFPILYPLQMRNALTGIHYKPSPLGLETKDF